MIWGIGDRWSVRDAIGDRYVVVSINIDDFRRDLFGAASAD